MAVSSAPGTRVLVPSPENTLTYTAAQGGQALKRAGFILTDKLDILQSHGKDGGKQPYIYGKILGLVVCGAGGILKASVFGRPSALQFSINSRRFPEEDSRAHGDGIA